MVGEERILGYAWRLKKDGYRESTIVSRVKMLRSLARRADLSNPEAIKAVVANLSVSDGRKENLVCVYGGFCRLYGIPFEAPRYRRVDQLPFIPLESEVDQLIAFMMFPILRKHNEALALGYVGFRTLEAVIVVAGTMSALSLLSLSQAFVKAGAPDAPYYEALGTLLLAARDWAFLLTALFFGLGALIFYYLLYDSRLVPRFVSVWGFLAAILIVVSNVPNMFGQIVPTTVGLLLALPIISNEYFWGFGS